MNSPTIKFCADFSPAHRCPCVLKFQIRLECASLNRESYSVSLFFLIAYLLISEVKRTEARFIEEKVNSVAKNSN